MPESQMRSIALAPSAELRPYVRQFLVVENLSNRASTLRPDTGVIAGIRFQGECSQDGTKALRAVATGLRDLPRRLTHTTGSATMLAMFTPAGAAAFVREPLHGLFNSTMPLDAQVRHSQLALVEEQLAEAAGHGERAEVFER